MQRQQQAAQAAEEQRQAILSQILSFAAKERLNRVKLVKPEAARHAEETVLNGVQNGRLRPPVSEDEVVQILEQISDLTNPTHQKITFKRRPMDDEDDEFAFEEDF